MLFLLSYRHDKFLVIHLSEYYWGRIAYFPVVGPLDCESTYADHRGFWEIDGFGLLSIYKSDWTKFGGK